MNNKLVLSGLKSFLNGIYRERYPRSFHYYNSNHSELLVEAIKEFAEDLHISKDEFFEVQVAGWFFDVSRLEYWEDINGAPTTISKLLRESGVEEEYIKPILNLLPADYSNNPPLSLLEQILSDALRFHWTKKSFNLWTEALRKDTEFMEGREIPVGDWLKQVMVFMQTYHFYTNHSKVLQRKKQKNLDLLEEQVKVLEHHNKVFHEHRSHHSTRIEDAEKPDKGIETMFRVATSNNQRLTSLGDNKAHILITVNSIILSAIISLLLRKLDDSSYLIYPTFTLLSVSLFSMIFAILATRPTIPKGRVNDDEPEALSANLLFFGNFYRMSLADYTDGMFRLMDDKKILYKSLIKDVYGQGIVLGKKYLMLRVAYNIFMFGLIISVVTFFIVFFQHTPAVQSNLPKSP